MAAKLLLLSMNIIIIIIIIIYLVRDEKLLKTKVQIELSFWHQIFFYILNCIRSGTSTNKDRKHENEIKCPSRSFIYKAYIALLLMLTAYQASCTIHQASGSG